MHASSMKGSALIFSLCGLLLVACGSPNVISHRSPSLAKDDPLAADQGNHDESLDLSHRRRKKSTKRPVETQPPSVPTQESPATGGSGTTKPVDENAGTPAPAPQPPVDVNAGTPAPAPQPPKTPETASGTTELAPYFFTWGGSGYSAKSLMDAKQKIGLKAANIAFVISGGGCSVSNDVDSMASDIKAFIAAGGKARISFGGANGPYVETACSDVAKITSLIEGVMQRTGSYHLDFDIEGSYVSDTGATSRRIQALVALFKKYPQMTMSYTVAVDARNGLDRQVIDMISNTAKAGVPVSYVNLMTMDYGYEISGKSYGDLVVMSVEKALTQVQPIFTGSNLYAKIGITPMIGKNDDGYVFKVSDADQVAAYAKQKGIGLLSFWALQRDQAGSGDIGQFSGANQSNFQFYQALNAATK